MTFAIPFVRDFKYFDDDIQLNIRYKPQIKQLNDFITKYNGYRINLIVQDLNEERDFPIFQTLYETFTQTEIVLCFPKFSRELQDKLNKNLFVHYYNEYVTTWDKFRGFLDLNITDIFLAEQIMFSIESISQVVHNKGIRIRTYCNVCESSWDETPSITTFFIRPEDIDLYAQYVDTFEFFTDGRDATKLNTLYEIYAKDKKWFGRFNEIIVGYTGEQDNRTFASQFGIRRLNCGKKCSKKIPTSYCNICERVADLSITLQKKGLIVTKG